MQNKRIKTGIMMNKKIIETCDKNLYKANVSSRNDFVEKAVIFYSGFLNTNENSDYLNMVIHNTLNDSIDLLEEELSRSLFKLSVEINILNSIISSLYEIDPEILNTLKKKSIIEVKNITGKSMF